MDRGAWLATVHGVAKSRTRLSDEHFHCSFKVAMNTFHCSFKVLVTSNGTYYTCFACMYYFLVKSSPQEREFWGEQHRLKRADGTAGRPWVSLGFCNTAYCHGDWAVCGRKSAQRWSQKG